VELLNEGWNVDRVEWNAFRRSVALNTPGSVDKSSDLAFLKEFFRDGGLLVVVDVGDPCSETLSLLVVLVGRGGGFFAIGGRELLALKGGLLLVGSDELREDCDDTDIVS